MHEDEAVIVDDGDDALPTDGVDDDDAAQYNSRTVIEATLRAHDAAMAEDEDARAEEGKKPRKRKRTEMVTLSPALMAVLSDDDNGDDVPSPRSHWGIPKGAKTTRNYLAVLEAAGPAVAPIVVTERMRLIDELSIEAITLKAGFYSVAPVHWNRAEGHRIFTEWHERNKDNPLRDDPLDREMYAMWREGYDAAEIATCLIGKQRHLTDADLAKRARRNVLYFERNHRELARYNEPEDQIRGDAHRFNLRGSYSVGNKVRVNILSAIPTLTTRAGEPPTAREIQAAIGATTTISRYLRELQDEGRIRHCQSGHGYEIAGRQGVVAPPKQFSRSS